MAKAKLGSGSRFKAVEKSAAKSGAANPAAVAAAAGRKAHVWHDQHPRLSARAVYIVGSAGRTLASQTTLVFHVPVNPPSYDTKTGAFPCRSKNYPDETSGTASVHDSNYAV